MHFNALRAEVRRFSENIRSKVERGMKGQELVNEVVMDWESVVNRVAKCELGEKMIVCGRAARWWDEQIKDRINTRREVYILWGVVSRRRVWLAGGMYGCGYQEVGVVGIYWCG